MHADALIERVALAIAAHREAETEPVYWAEAVAVLDALGLEQVGWDHSGEPCPMDTAHGYADGEVRCEDHPGTEPVYVLRGRS